MPKSLLCPHHFASRSVLRLGDRGFEADFTVDAKARHSFLLEGETRVLPSLREKPDDRPSTRHIINPEQVSPQQLQSHFRAIGSRHDGPEDFTRFMRGRRKYPSKLSIGPRYSNDDGVVVEEYLPEGQSVFIVCFDGEEPAGFIAAHLSATLSSARKTVTIDTLLDMVCVVPGPYESSDTLDLTIASCRVVQSLIGAVYRAAPRGAELRGSIDGDARGPTGRHLAGQIHLRMVKAFEVLGRRGRRRTVFLGKVENHLPS